MSTLREVFGWPGESALYVIIRSARLEKDEAGGANETRPSKVERVVLVYMSLGTAGWL